MRAMDEGIHGKTRIDFDDLMRHLVVVGFAALTAWTIVSATGVALGMLTISGQATLRFLLAVLVVVFARRTYWEINEWRWNRLPPDERFGFDNPLADHPRRSDAVQDGWGQGEDHRAQR
jgi:hypothetical protein